ncbi:MAG: hypothetical protein VX294_13165 [Candidatus Latescibacterota bacterium]|nr:hypothetical protein [Candidatus Latescibacterota bacterium]
MKNIINERVLILAFNIKTGENNIDQVSDCLREGLYLTDLLFVAPAGYLLTFKSRTETNPNVTSLRADSELEEPDQLVASEHSTLSRALQQHSFMTVSYENNSGK